MAGAVDCGGGKEAQKPCGVKGAGAGVRWVQSCVTGDKIYCVYIAADEQLVREHARLSGIPATKISRIVQTIDPTMAE